MDLDTPCKIWPGKLESRTGYGRKKVAGKAWMAHRWAYQEFYGDLSDDLVVDHLCFNRGCVEPAHLRQITLAENAARHKPDCGCSVCHPDRHASLVCSRGHDISHPEARTRPRTPTRRGECLICYRDRNRDRMREHRAALNAQPA